MRFTWLDAVIIGGGVFITAVIVSAVAKAKEQFVCPTCKSEFATLEELQVHIATAHPPNGDGVIPPNGDGVIPGIPAAIHFPVYPTSLNQLYGFYYTMASPAHPQILNYKVLTSFRGPPYPEGHVSQKAEIRVVDAAGRGVPNVAVLIWSVPTSDDQTGRLIIDNAMRSEAQPLRLVTDGNGEILLSLNYLLKAIKYLEDKHHFGCCVPFGWAYDIDVGGGCGPVPFLYLCYKNRDGQTVPRAYTVNAKIEGTVKTNLFVVSCQAVGKTLW